MGRSVVHKNVKLDMSYSETCVKQPLSKRPKIGFQDQLSLNAGQKYCRMLQGEHSAILSTFIRLPFVTKIFVLSIFECPFYIGFTVCITDLNLLLFTATERWSKEANSPIKVYRCRFSQNVEFRFFWEPRVSQSGFYSSYKCLRERFGQTTVITLPKSLVHSGEKFVYFISSTINVLKFQTPFLFLFK